MTIIEALTIGLGLSYAAALLYASQQRYGALALLGTLVLAVLIANQASLWLAVALSVAIAAALHRSRWGQQWLTEIDAERLRLLCQHTLALSMLIAAIQYGGHLWFLEQGQTPPLPRPDVVDAFLPVAGGLGLRGAMETGQLDQHHPAAMVMLALVLLTGLLLKRAFCGWVCPLGLAGDYLHRLGNRLFPAHRGVPLWLDWPLRMIKYLLASALVYLVVVALPAAALPGYLKSSYHIMADVKMAQFFVAPGPLTVAAMSILILASMWRRQAFCRYLCPYGALMGLLSLLSPMKIQRQPNRCLNHSKGLACDKCSRACPAGIAVHQQRRIHSDECQACLRCVSACPKRAQALSLTLANQRPVEATSLFALLVVTLLLLPLVAQLFGLWHSNTDPMIRMQLMQMLDRLGMS
ncbi:4Fe-4S binding protein [Ferrimonas sp. SCSIO 43195]|uniref:4Fe-4S binding protein n=1 Tax=Ferrimonas sp. SCSIO 43195 TaxID=2822844 RepID=UPI002074FA63|nr:4Fe-4S binding protein [Ferrimonas sp. SCSIO 43195]USD38865.1 4Fe-4S binding protein [Ferrimonas sp. SCSIO 43195]